MAGLVIVTGDGPEHRFIVNRILRDHPVAAILLCDPPPRRSWKATLRASPRRFLDKALRQLFLRLIGDARAREAALARFLGPASTGFDRPDLVIRVGRPKTGDLARRIADLTPEVIAVYGTGLIPARVLAQARTIALNLHTGLSPWYRGTACALWPLVDCRPDMIGATVHECTAVLDGGRIFFRQAADISAAADLHEVFALAVRAGADGYAETIGRALSGTLSGEPQDLSVGREYHGAELGIWAELAARRGLRRAQSSAQ
jgi:methionyl-tRNA formyltransferase